MASLDFADGYNSASDSDFDPSSIASESESSEDSDDGKKSPDPYSAATAEPAVVKCKQRPRRRAFVAAQSYIKDEIARTMQLKKGGTKRKAAEASGKSAIPPAKKRKTTDKKVAKADGQPDAVKKQ